MSSIRVLIVDDEVHARKGLRTLLAREPDVVVVGEASNGTDAVAAILSLLPDVVLLDVEMPDCDGLQVVAKVGPDTMPDTIFITAHDQYAVAAFEAQALDYLLKPFSNERFHTALERVRARRLEHGFSGLAGNLTALLDQHSRAISNRFTVRVGDAFEVFRDEEIDWIEADEYYARLHIGERAFLIRHTMKSLEKQLSGDRFVRIHRSTIVNFERVVSLEPQPQGDFKVVLQDGTRLRMSRRRREVLAKRLKTFT